MAVNKYFPTSFREWAGDMREAGSGVKNFTKGAVVKAPAELYYFPTDALRLVLGVDSQYGEGRNLTAGQVLTGIWKTYNDWASEENNPL